MWLSTSVSISVDALGQKNPDGRVTLDPIYTNTRTHLASGNGANQADQSWGDTRVLAEGASETIDFVGLIDAFGDVFTFARIKVLRIKNTISSGMATLRVGNGSWTDMFQSSMDVPPQGEFCAVCPVSGGWPVAGGGSTLQMLHRGSTLSGTYNLTYEITAVGSTL